MESRPIPRGLVTDVASIFGTQVAALALQFCSGVLLARVLGPAGRGTYAIVTLIPATVATVGGLGIAPAVAHFAAREIAPARALFGNVLLLAVGLGVGYAFGLHVVLDPSWPSLQGLDPAVVALVCSSIPILLLNDYALALLLGHGRVATRNVAKLLEAGTLLTVVTALLLAGGRGVWLAILGWLTSLLVVAGFELRACARLAGSRPRVSLPALRATVAKGLQGAVGLASTFLLLRSDLYLVTHFLGARSAGYYAVAASLAGLLLVLPTAIGSALLPKVSRLQGPSGRHVSAAACRFATGVTLASCVALALVASPLVLLVYGEPFGPSVAPLRWLLPGVAAASVGLVLATDLQGRGNFHVGSIATSVALVVNVLLNLFAIPRWGLAGAAISSSLAYALAAGIVLVAYTRGAVVRWYEPLLLRPSDIRELRAATLARFSA